MSQKYKGLFANFQVKLPKIVAEALLQLSEEHDASLSSTGRLLIEEALRARGLL